MIKQSLLLLLCAPWFMALGSRGVHIATKEDDSSFLAFEIVTPVKVTSAGNFLSHDLTHSHIYENGRTRRRRRRDVNPLEMNEDDRLEDKVHYMIHIDGEHHMVELEPNHLFLAPHAVIERRSKFDYDMGYSEDAKIGPMMSHVSVVGSLPNCHFTGYLINQTVSRVALSTCHGLKGFLKTTTGEYLIEPLNNSTRSRDQPHPHKVYRRPRLPDSKHTNSNCGSQEDFFEALKDRENWESDIKKMGDNDERKEENYVGETREGRHKRSVSVERNVEVMVVADKKMIDFYSNEDLNTYILTIMNMVSSIYHDASIGNAVNIIVVRIMLLETPQYEEELEISHNADDTLVSFCQWQKMVNPSSEDHPHHHDVAVLLTRYNICSRSNAHCSTLGLAEIAGMCQPHRSCNVNEDTGLQIAYTIAHEIGHNFGMNHDSSVNGCGSHFGVSQHVMSPHLATDSIPITWSNCSRDEITNFLDREWGMCLLDEPLDIEYNFPELPPGAMYDADHQCRLAFGARARHCDGIELECQNLWCRVNNRCVTRLEPAAQGTQCGKHKWCYYGKCVTMGERPAAIHGSWGQWSEWSGCSRSCGAGVEIASRLCDNPSPSNGGKYCTGDRRRYRICNVHECPNNGISFRAVQCSEFDKEPFKGQNHTWGPVTLERSPCQLHCKPDNEFYSIELKDTVVDGTPCKPGTRDMCIHGVCKRVSCDWTIEGTAQEDRCGLCHGDGTQCVTSQGFFNVTQSVSYVDIVTFPEGAMKVRVEELGDASNYLAVKDNTTGRSFLNGNWIIQWSGEYNANGVMMYYKRDNETESLFLPGPVKTPLTLMLLFQTENPGIKWEYTMPHENATYTPEFHWHSSDWSVCTRTCGGGTQQSKAQCMEKEAGLVEDKYCDEETRPDDKKRECNTHACPAWWWSGPWQPCSVTCGENGNRRRTVICVRSYGPTEQMALMDSDCSMALKPHEEEKCPDLLPCLSDQSWVVGPWIESCRGDPCEFERRDVHCNSIRGPCDPSTRPNELRQCGNLTCGYWKAGEWGQCSSACGEGVQIRSVECIGGVACTQREEPKSVKECKLFECSSVNFVNTTLHETIPETLSDISPSLKSSDPDRKTKSTDLPANSSKLHEDQGISMLEHVEELDVNSGNNSDETIEAENQEAGEENVSEIDSTSIKDIPFNDDKINVEYPETVTKINNNEKIPIQNDNEPEKNITTIDIDDNNNSSINDTASGTDAKITATENSNNDMIGTDTNYTEISQGKITDEKGNETEIIKADEENNSKHKTVIDSSKQDSLNPFKVTSNDSFLDYEATPDEYYESDLEDNDLEEVMIETKTMKGSNENLKEGKEKDTLLKNDTTVEDEKEKEEEGGDFNSTVAVVDWDSDKEVNSSSNDKKDEIRNKISKGDEHDDRELKDTGVNVKDNEILDYNYYEDDDYTYEDYYDYEDELFSGRNSTEKLSERPSGIVEDKIDVDDVQVIEIKLRKNNKKTKKHRHKKYGKDKIKKVKIHTGADAMKVLKRITKKANSKKESGKEESSYKFKPETVIPVYKWAIGDWSKCSDPCGGGSQRRAVECHDSSTDSVVPPWECHSLPPPDLQHCNMFQCLNWTLSEFGPCSASCDDGIRYRNASCPEKGKCHEKDLPPMHERCNEAPCVQWVEGPWSMCTKSCGGGYQIRFVKCVDARTQEASQNCKDERPPHKRSCNTNECQQTRQGQQNHCKDYLDTKLCRRLVHMCSTKFFRVKCCRTCHRLRG